MKTVAGMRMDSNTEGDGDQTVQLTVSSSTHKRLAVRLLVHQTLRVSLCIFDLSGRLVEDLARGRFTAGEYSLSWDMKEIQSGVYYLSLKTDKTHHVRRLMISH